MTDLDSLAGEIVSAVYSNVDGYGSMDGDSAKADVLVIISRIKQGRPMVDKERLAKWLCNQYAVATHPQIAPTWETESELSKTLWRGNARALLAALPTVLEAMPTREEIDDVVTEAFAKGDDGIVDQVAMTDAIMALLGKGCA